MDHSSSSAYCLQWAKNSFEVSAGYRLAVTLDSDVDEQEIAPDILKECTNQDEHHVSEKTAGHNMVLSDSACIETDENNDVASSIEDAKEIEWWNEITSWRNCEDFNIKTTKEPSDDEVDGADSNRAADDSDYETQGKRRFSKKKLGPSVACHSYVGECPLTFDGAFGLLQEHHQHQLCTTVKHYNKRICLYQHFNKKHGFTRQVSIRLVKAILCGEDPCRAKLFSPTSDTPATLFDPFHKVRCPLATRCDATNTPCLTQEISRKSIRRHLAGVHRLDPKTINKVMKEMIK